MAPTTSPLDTNDTSMETTLSTEEERVVREEQVDERNFFILRVVVRVSVVVTLLTLAAAFGLLFWRNWINWREREAGVNTSWSDQEA